MTVTSRVVLVGSLFFPLLALAQPGSGLYKCPNEQGRVEYSDKPCNTGGLQRQGDGWISMQELERQKKARDAELARLEAEERKRKGAQVDAEIRAKKEREEQFKAEIAAAAAAGPKPGATAASDLNKLSTYAVVLGRAVGCGIDVSEASRRVGSWVDVTYVPGTKEHASYTLAMAQGIANEAARQRSGKSPDSCSVVRAQTASMPWP